jgi:hypothetical protein
MEEPAADRESDCRMTTSVARLKIVLDDVEPVVMRRIEVPFDIRLDRLHLVLQTVLGWINSYLYEFRIKNIGFGMPGPAWGDGPLDARKATLPSAIEDTGAKSFKYLHDFGDGWEHSVKIERIAPAVPGLDPLSLIDATGACPPEDIGGSWGYQEFIEALADPGHERHEELVEWWGSDQFDRDAVDKTAITEALRTLAKKWSRKTRSKAVSDKKTPSGEAA